MYESRNRSNIGSSKYASELVDKTNQFRSSNYHRTSQTGYPQQVKPFYSIHDDNNSSTVHMTIGATSSHRVSPLRPSRDNYKFTIQMVDENNDYPSIINRD